MTRIIKPLILTMALLAAGVWGYNVGTLNPRVMTTNNEAVKAVCDYSHLNFMGEGAGAWEEACGLAQDSTDTEYLCNHARTRCWVENK